MTFSSTGLLSDASGNVDLATRGFLAPDSSMLIVQFESNTAAQQQQFPGFPGTSLYVGLPRGTSCNNSTLNGAYTTAALSLTGEDTQGSSGTFDGEVSTETAPVPLVFDGSGGLEVQSHPVRETTLSFGGTPMLNRDTFTDSTETFTYSVRSDCSFEVVEESGSLGTHINGIVSPDGESVVMGVFDNEEGNALPLNNGQRSTVDTQILAGFRSPQQ